MKNKYLLLVILLLTIFSCKKETSTKAPENAVKDPEKLYAVSFNVSGTNLETKSSSKIATNAISVTDGNIKFISLYSVDENNKPIQVVAEQTAGDPSFGKLKFNLKHGTYSFILVADAYPTSPNNKKGAIVSLESHQLYGYGLDSQPGTPAYVGGDTYMAKVKMLIAQPKDTSIVLKRVTSRITILLKDKLPQNTSKILLNYNNNNFYGLDLSTMLGYTKTSTNGNNWGSTRTPKPQDLNKTNVRFGFYAWPAATKSYTITITSNDGTVITNKELKSDNLPDLKPNTDYVISGYFLNSGTDIKLQVDTAWEPPVELPFSTVKISH